MTMIDRPRLVIVALVMATAALLVTSMLGCARGRKSENPPIHLNPDMDHQPKYKAQSSSAFFPDSASMRQPVAGTVARGFLRENDVFFKGKDSRGNPVKTAPLPMTLQALKRGQERYDIYCSPCHSRVGDGRGIMVTRGYVPPPTFHSDRLRDIEDGHLYDVITNGIRNMPGYANQVPPDDRWKIVL